MLRKRERVTSNGPIESAAALNKVFDEHSHAAALPIGSKRFPFLMFLPSETGWSFRDDRNLRQRWMGRLYSLAFWRV